MSDAVLVGLVGLVGIALTAFFTWRGVSRQSESSDRRASGDIKTSEAATLWNESQAIRKDLREDLVREREERRAEHAECDRKLAALQAQLEQQRDQLATMQSKLREAGGQP